MQEKTLKEEIELVFSDQFVMNIFSTKRNDVLRGRILSFISSREEKAREEGYAQGWNEHTTEVDVEVVRTQYKEELLGKLPEELEKLFKNQHITLVSQQDAIRFFIKALLN